MKTSLQTLSILILVTLIFGCSKKLEEKYSNNNLPVEYKPEKNVIGMVYGEKHVFTVMTPNGWVLDRKVAKENNLGSFFYPESSITPIITYMYAQGWDKDSVNPNIDVFIKGDIETFKTSNPKLIASNIETIITHDSSRALIYEFKNLDNAAGECVAYIDVPSTICVLVYSSKDIKEYKV